MRESKRWNWFYGRNQFNRLNYGKCLFFECKIAIDSVTFSKKNVKNAKYSNCLACCGTETRKCSLTFVNVSHFSELGSINKSRKETSILIGIGNWAHHHHGAFVRSLRIVGVDNPRERERKQWQLPHRMLISVEFD